MSRGLLLDEVRAPSQNTSRHLSVRIDVRLVRALAWVLGLALIAWACADPRFRDTEGALRGTICLPLAAAVSLAVVGYTAVGPLRLSGFWFGIALVGQAVALQLVNAGPLMHYQHYQPAEQSLLLGLVLM